MRHLHLLLLLVAAIAIAPAEDIGLGTIPTNTSLLAPGPIGSTTPAAGAFTTLSATGLITSTLATGSAPLSIASTTVVPNLNVSQLLGGTWAIPGSIGATTPAAGSFTTLAASGATTLTANTASTSTSTGALVVTGGAGFGGAINVTSASRFGATGTANALVHVKQSADSNAGGLRLERNATTDCQTLFLQSSLGSLNDVLTFNSSFSGSIAAIDRSGIGYFASKLLIATTTDNSTGALQVNGAAKITGNLLTTASLGVGVTSTVTAAATTTMTTASTACQVFTGSTTQTLTLPAANVLGAGVAYVVYVKNLSTGLVTVSRAGSDTINSTASNVTTFTLAQWASCTLYSDGVSAWERF